MIGRNRAISHQ